MKLHALRWALDGVGAEDPLEQLDVVAWFISDDGSAYPGEPRTVVRDPDNGEMHLRWASSYDVQSTEALTQKMLALLPELWIDADSLTWRERIKELP